MNPVLILLILIGAILLWFIMADEFKHIGKFFNSLASNVKDEMYNNNIKDERNKK